MSTTIDLEYDVNECIGYDFARRREVTSSTIASTACKRADWLYWAINDYIHMPTTDIEPIMCDPERLHFLTLSPLRACTIGDGWPSSSDVVATSALCDLDPQQLSNALSCKFQLDSQYRDASRWELVGAVLDVGTFTYTTGDEANGCRDYEISFARANGKVSVNLCRDNVDWPMIFGPSLQRSYGKISENKWTFGGGAQLDPNVVGASAALRVDDFGDNGWFRIRAKNTHEYGRMYCAVDCVKLRLRLQSLATPAPSSSPSSLPTPWPTPLPTPPLPGTGVNGSLTMPTPHPVQINALWPSPPPTLPPTPEHRLQSSDVDFTNFFYIGGGLLLLLLCLAALAALLATVLRRRRRSYGRQVKAMEKGSGAARGGGGGDGGRVSSSSSFAGASRASRRTRSNSAAINAINNNSSNSSGSFRVRAAADSSPLAVGPYHLAPNPKPYNDVQLSQSQYVFPPAPTTTYLYNPHAMASSYAINYHYAQPTAATFSTTASTYYLQAHRK